MNANYQTIAVELDHNEQSCRIAASRDEKGVLFSFFDGSEASEFSITDEFYQNSLRVAEDYVRDADGEYFRIRETAAELPEGIVPFQAVRRLPTPIFLGLDRTTLPGGPKPGPRNRRNHLAKRTHATLRTFLDESVAQAETIAVDAARHANLMRARHASNLREQILLTLFSQVEDDDDALPRTADLRRYEKARKSLKVAFTVLGIDKQRVEEAIDPFFSEVIGIGTLLSKTKSIHDVMALGPDTAEKRALFSWFSRAPRVSLIRKVEEFVNIFNVRESETFSNTEKYLKIMNSFLGDSRKELSFREDGNLSVKLPSGTLADVYHLSSGERQLFVLITSLMFSDEQRRANAVIIDEPELSLHLKWQEMFVDSLMQANPNIQLILATHSPSIILDRDDACVELV
jgi:hypothetical protein